MEAFRKYVIETSNEESKHTFVLHAVEGKIVRKHLSKWLHKLTARAENCDFFIVILIRVLFLGKDGSEVAEAKLQIERALLEFPFWPSDDTIEFPSNFVFWSENHIFMLLSSRYLLKQFIATNSRTESHVNSNDLETVLLIAYLEAHCATGFHNGGVYEVLSHVYLPYTLSALFNLYDFATDPRIHEMSKTLIDVIMTQIVSCLTISNGVCTFAASARAYRRTRLRTTGHNVNQLMNIVVGSSPDAPAPSSITDFICTTSWRPSQVIFAALFTERISQLSINPATFPFHDWTRNYAENLSDDAVEAQEPSLNTYLYSSCSAAEATPLLWSAGLITHPEFITCM